MNYCYLVVFLFFFVPSPVSTNSLQIYSKIQDNKTEMELYDSLSMPSSYYSEVTDWYTVSMDQEALTMKIHLYTIYRNNALGWSLEKYNKTTLPAKPEDVVLPTFRGSPGSSMEIESETTIMMHFSGQAVWRTELTMTTRCMLSAANWPHDQSSCQVGFEIEYSPSSPTNFSLFVSEQTHYRNTKDLTMIGPPTLNYSGSYLLEDLEIHQIIHDVVIRRDPTSIVFTIEVPLFLLLLEAFCCAVTGGAIEFTISLGATTAIGTSMLSLGQMLNKSGPLSGLGILATVIHFTMFTCCFLVYVQRRVREQAKAVKENKDKDAVQKRKDAEAGIRRRPVAKAPRGCSKEWWRYWVIWTLKLILRNAGAVAAFILCSLAALLARPLIYYMRT